MSVLRALRLEALPPERLIWVGVGASAALSGLAWLVTPDSPWAGRALHLLMTGCVALMLLCWWRLGPRFEHQVGVAVLWALPLFAAPPLFSQDVAAYLAQGRMLAEGLDPYTTPLAVAELPGLPVGHHWAGTTAVYPAGSVMIFQLAHGLSLGHAGLGIFWLRLLHLAALAATVAAVRRLAQHLDVPVRSALWLGVTSPLLILQWIGGVHNDAVVVAAVAWAAVLALRGGWSGLLLGGAMIGVGMLVKQSAAFAGFGIVAIAVATLTPRSWRDLAVRAGAAGGVAVAVFVLVSVASGLGFGWARPTAGSPLTAMNFSPWSWLAQLSLRIAPGGAALPVLSALSGITVLLALVWVVRRWGPTPEDPGRPWLVLTCGLLAFMLAGPAIQPWYLTWAAPFLIFCLPRTRPAPGTGIDTEVAAVVAVAAVTLLGPLQGAIDALPALAVTVGVVWWLLRRPRSDASMTSG